MTAENTTQQDTTTREMTQEEIDEITIEATVLVYLNWDGALRRWVVAPCTMDDAPLDTHGDAHGEGDIYTDFGGYDQMPAQKRSEWDEAAKVRVPTGAELIELLQEHQPPF